MFVQETHKYKEANRTLMIRETKWAADVEFVKRKPPVITAFTELFPQSLQKAQ